MYIFRNPNNSQQNQHKMINDSISSSGSFQEWYNDNISNNIHLVQYSSVVIINVKDHITLSYFVIKGIINNSGNKVIGLIIKSN